MVFNLVYTRQCKHYTRLFVMMALIFAYLNYDHNGTRVIRSLAYQTGAQHHIGEVLTISLKYTNILQYIVYKSFGEYLTFKGWLYITKKLVATILYEYHNAHGYFS